MTEGDGEPACAAQQRLLTSLGLLRDDTLHMPSAMVLSRLGYGALVAWVAKMAGISTFQAVLLCISTGLRSTKQGTRNSPRDAAGGRSGRGSRRLHRSGAGDAAVPRQAGNRTPARQLVDENRGLAGIEQLPSGTGVAAGGVGSSLSEALWIGGTTVLDQSADPAFAAAKRSVSTEVRYCVPWTSSR